MMKVVASATCSMDSSKNRRFESLFHCPTFTHDMIQKVLFALRFLFTRITWVSRMLRFLMWSGFVSSSLSHAV